MTDRIGLYIMVGLGMIASIRSCDQSSEIEERLANKIGDVSSNVNQLGDKLEGVSREVEELNKYPLKIEEKNVIGSQKLEKFYQINGQKFYLEIDGKPVEQYFKK